MKKKSYSYEDEKRDAIEAYLKARPRLKEEWKFREVNIELMKIKVDIQIAGRSCIKRFRLKVDRILAENNLK